MNKVIFEPLNFDKFFVQIANNLWCPRFSKAPNFAAIFGVTVSWIFSEVHNGKVLILKVCRKHEDKMVSIFLSPYS